MYRTPIYKIKENLNCNSFYMKREDLLPFSFGGNKARKAEYFKKDILRKKVDTIVTYGSSESNHCRIVANMAKSLNYKCYIISPSDNYIESYNSKIVRLFGAKIIKVSTDKVSLTIDELMKKLSKENKPYFIPGGGHGNLGTKAYVDAYQEIREYEIETNVKFDYIFFASGTGTTHAGLVCGQIINKDYDKKIVGISIARKKDRGEKIIKDSIYEFMNNDEKIYDQFIEFVDDYVLDGYNNYDANITETIKKVFFEDGVALNTTYTGKAFYGMKEYIKKNKIKNKNILFINTGGLPIFFDDMGGLINEHTNN